MTNKKTIAYITRHNVSNYGSVLQAYATQVAIENLGYNAVCIDYQRIDEKPKNLAYTRLQCSKWNKNILTRLIYMVTQKPVYLFADKKFEKYRQIVKTTDKEYNTEQQLIEDTPSADIYLTGSDQVWNTITCDKIDPVFFMSFLNDSCERSSYGASFGGASIKESDRDIIATHLKKYSTITVRENSGVKIANSLGINAQQVLDPTFLLSSNEWEKLLPNRRCSEKYVLVYQLHPNKEFVKYAKSFAESKGLKLYRISHCFHHIVRSGKFICCPPLEEFLWYIKNSEYFLTDSFHGTAFAIGFNKQFVNVLPHKYSERISSVLQLIGHENRILQSYDDFNITNNNIDYSIVNEKLKQEREKSYKILKEMLEG